MPLRQKLLTTAALALALFALIGGGLFLNSHSIPPAWAQTTTDYDSDDDGLIEVSSLAQLNAIRWDLDGDGVVDDTANQTSYTAAFANAAAGMGCPDGTDADTNPDPCAGYELHGDLTFDSNGDGSVTAADSAGFTGTAARAGRRLAARAIPTGGSCKAAARLFPICSSAETPPPLMLLVCSGRSAKLAA